ncbi:tyrosine-protein phosphatase non-receptor type 12 isoform X1 [Lethenteron reissneri]|uniref:tyrosine-protein phosphatase non-receptor type 12 isoform X1 n=1 Tax=Lethenteron reissneri TaxID=7753 RepID=UPI002AB78499|nr:tyrosine-protein phosphatase non-receptor type 12 isoform X1 [Lethenteron reissneri]
MELVDILRKLVARVASLRDVDAYGEDGFAEEFARLRRQSMRYRSDRTYPTTSGENEDNMRKNRYKDILPFEHSRVKLAIQLPAANSDYINANFIKGVSNPRAYIATQGPLPHTLVDFWSMLWEHNVKVIVMACQEVEMGRKKCERYYALTQEEPLTLGPFTISLLQVEKQHRGEDYCIRTLSVHYGNETRTVFQFHYSNWPDHDVPSSFDPILEMIAIMREYQDDEDSPICVHCSAGCGRTGAICAIDYTRNLLKLGKIPENFSVFNLIQDMRTQRPSAVQTKDQYELVHCAIAQLFQQQILASSPCLNSNLPALATDDEADLSASPPGTPDLPPPKPPRVKSAAQRDEADVMEEILQPPRPIPVPPVISPSVPAGFLTISCVWQDRNDRYHADATERYHERDATGTPAICETGGCGGTVEGSDSDGNASGDADCASKAESSAEECRTEKFNAANKAAGDGFGGSGSRVVESTSPCSAETLENHGQQRLDLNKNYTKFTGSVSNANISAERPIHLEVAPPEDDDNAPLGKKPSAESAGDEAASVGGPDDDGNSAETNARTIDLELKRKENRLAIEVKKVPRPETLKSFELAAAPTPSRATITPVWKVSGQEECRGTAVDGNRNVEVNQNASVPPNTSNVKHFVQSIDSKPNVGSRATLSVEHIRKRAVSPIGFHPGQSNVRYSSVSAPQPKPGSSAVEKFNAHSTNLNVVSSAQLGTNAQTGAPSPASPQDKAAQQQSAEATRRGEPDEGTAARTLDGSSLADNQPLPSTAAVESIHAPDPDSQDSKAEPHLHADRGPHRPFGEQTNVAAALASGGVDNFKGKQTNLAKSTVVPVGSDGRSRDKSWRDDVGCVAAGKESAPAPARAEEEEVPGDTRASHRLLDLSLPDKETLYAVGVVASFRNDAAFKGSLAPAERTDCVSHPANKDPDKGGATLQESPESPRPAAQAPRSPTQPPAAEAAHTSRLEGSASKPINDPESLAARGDEAQHRV